MSSSAAITVLVADDDDDVRALVAFTLRRVGFTTVVGHSTATPLDAVLAVKAGR